MIIVKSHLTELSSKTFVASSGGSNDYAAMLADRIRIAREWAKKRQRDLAKHLGVTPQAVSQWESGKDVPKDTERLNLIATFYGVRVEWLVYERGAMVDGHAKSDSTPEDGDKFHNPVAIQNRHHLALSHGAQADLQRFRDRPFYEFQRPARVGGFFPVPGRPVMHATKIEGVEEAYSFKMPDDSMSPAVRYGYTVHVNPRVPPAAGTEVVMRLTDGSMLVTLLVEDTEKAFVCKQHSQKNTYKISREEVTGVHYIEAVVR